MPRYIDADKLIELATHEGAYGYVDVHDILQTPTADVVERKKGEWIDCGSIWGDEYEHRMWRCSECTIPNYKKTRFCPNCGADMRGKKTNV